MNLWTGKCEAMEYEQYQHRENLKLRKPTKQEVTRTIRMLNDFNIKVYEVPVFETVRDMNQWRATLIMSVM